MREIISTRTLTFLIVALVVALVMTALAFVRPSFISSAEGRILARFYRLRGPAQPSNRIVIASVDDASIEKIGKWPWPHRKYVQMIDRLRAAEVAVMVFDADVADAVMSEDRHVRNSISEKKDIVLGFEFYPQREDIPLEDRAKAMDADRFDVLTTQMLASTRVPLEHVSAMGGVKTIPEQLRVIGGTLGFTNFLAPKNDALVSVPMLVRYRNLIVPSLALATVARV